MNEQRICCVLGARDFLSEAAGRSNVKLLSDLRPETPSTSRLQFSWPLNKRISVDTEGAGIWGDSLGAISHIKLQGANGGILHHCLPLYP